MYTQFFGLKGRPFGLSADPKYFFNSKTHKQAMTQLGYGLGKGQGIVVVTGEPGTGKTTLMSSLMHLLPKANIVTARVVNTYLESSDLLQYISAEFKLPYKDLSKVEMLRGLENFLFDCKATRKRAVIFIDEAQNLTKPAIEELRMLNNLVIEDKSVLQIVLLGQPELINNMHGDEFETIRQNVIATFQLNRLSEDEIKKYIIHRLRTAGWEGRPAISDDVYPAISEYSEGLPRKINSLFDRILLQTAIENQPSVTLAIVARALEELNSEFSPMGMGVENTVIENWADNLQKVLEENLKPEVVTTDNHFTEEKAPATKERISLNPSFDQDSSSTKDTDDEIRQWLAIKKSEAENKEIT